MFYSDKKEAELDKIIKVKEIKLPRKCVFFGQRSVQHGGDGWKENHCLRYHLYSIPKHVEFKDAVGFSYVDSMQEKMQGKCVVLLSFEYPLYMSDEKGGADNSLSSNTNTVDMTGDGDKNSATDVWPDHSRGASTENS